MLSSLAAQAEVSGDLTRAQALHQRRVLAANDPSVWADYGAYWLRRGGAELARAEECYREVLALEAGHLGAVEGLLATTLQRVRLAGLEGWSGAWGAFWNVLAS